MTYLVISCTSCGTVRIARQGRKTASCPRCGSQTTIDDAIVHARTDELEQAQNALGQVNAQRAGGELADVAVQEVTDRDEIDRALADARDVTSERMRVRLAAEGLTRELDRFTEERWIEALGRLDIERARALEHLEQLVRVSEVTEPRHGVYRYVE